MPSSAEVGAWDSCQECGLGSTGPQTGETSPALALGTGAIFGGHHEGFHGFALLHAQAWGGGGVANNGLPARRGLHLELTLSF